MPKKYSRKRYQYKSKGRSRSRGGKQTIYNMKGCSKIGGDTPIAPYRMKGGCGGTCGLRGGTSGLRGGSSFYGQPSPIFGPFIGSNWTPAISGWPGVNGIGGDNNYLAQNLYKSGDPQTMMKLGGTKKRVKRVKRGGGLVPQTLQNLGNEMAFNMKSAYNSLNGYSAPQSPLPYQDQLSRNNIRQFI